MLKGPGGFQKIVNGSMNIAIGICMSIAILAIMQSQPEFAGVSLFTPIAVLQSVVLSFCVGYTGGDLVPAMVWGQRLVGALRIKNRIGIHIVTSVVLGTCMAVVITFVCAFINNIVAQGMAGVIGFFLSFIPIIIGIAVLIVLILLAPVMKMASTISGFDPMQAPPAED
jgi:hypothetical protein